MRIHPRIFVSYSQRSENAKLFITLLKQYVELRNTRKPKEPQFEVWTDSNLRAGDDWSDKIDEALKSSFALIIALTPEATESHYVTYEWAYALGRKCFVLPVLITPPDDDRFHRKLKDLQWDKSWTETEYSKAVEELFALLESKYYELRRQDRQDAGREVAQRVLNYLNLGRRQRTSGDFNNAMTSLKAAVDNIRTFHEQFPAPLNTVGDEDYTEVDKLEDDVYYEMGIIHYLRGHFGEAREFFLRTLDKNPTHVHSIVGLGIFHRITADRSDELKEYDSKLTHLEQAYQHFFRALELQRDVRDQNDESIWASLGGICKRMGRKDEAIDCYQMATQFRKSAYPYGNLGVLYMEMGDRDRMIANFRVCKYFAQARLRLQPDDRWAHNDELVSQLILNTCSDNPAEKIGDDEMKHLIDRVLIVVEGEPLKRLRAVLRHDLLPQQPPVVDAVQTEHILQRIDALLA
ncbi:MAG: tetratricopeptide repeat protein [Anaerolinea sp.]|nr:tetratricopeptide repeat protein [Anaerolinea sp.]